MKDLIEAVLDRGPIYRYADPFGALNLAGGSWYITIDRSAPA